MDETQPLQNRSAHPQFAEAHRVLVSLMVGEQTMSYPLERTFTVLESERISHGEALSQQRRRMEESKETLRQEAEDSDGRIIMFIIGLGGVLFVVICIFFILHTASKRKMARRMKKELFEQRERIKQRSQPVPWGKKITMKITCH